MSIPCWYSDSNTLIIKGANSEALNVFGYSEEEFIGLRADRLVSPTDQSRIVRVRNVEKWGEVGSFTFIRKDGTEFSANMRWHQSEYHGTLCDCTIITGIGLGNGEDACKASLSR